MMNLDDLGERASALKEDLFFQAILTSLMGMVYMNDVSKEVIMAVIASAYLLGMNAATAKTAGYNPDGEKGT